MKTTRTPGRTDSHRSQPEMWLEASQAQEGDQVSNLLARPGRPTRSREYGSPDSRPGSDRTIPLVGVVLDAPNPPELARFYQQLLGWKIVSNDKNWASMKGPEGSSKLSIQREPRHRPPTWPSEPDRQQMQIHLDFKVTDLEAAHQLAVKAGATPMNWQPQKEGVRIFADPVGHIFCLFLPGW